jgi:hypothetical protein
MSILVNPYMLASTTLAKPQVVAIDSGTTTSTSFAINFATLGAEIGDVAWVMYLQEANSRQTAPADWSEIRDESGLTWATNSTCGLYITNIEFG